MSKNTKTICMACFVWAIISIPLLLYSWINHITFLSIIIAVFNTFSAIYTTYARLKFRKTNNDNEVQHHVAPFSEKENSFSLFVKMHRKE